MKYLIYLIWGDSLLAACGGHTGHSADLQPGEEARVVRILDGDTIALSTGLVGEARFSRSTVIRTRRMMNDASIMPGNPRVFSRTW